MSDERLVEVNSNTLNDLAANCYDQEVMNRREFAIG